MFLLERFLFFLNILAELDIDLGEMFDPIFLFIISKICFFYGLGFTAAGSLLRPVLFVVILLTCLCAVRSPRVYIVPGAAGCDYIIGFIFHASNFLLIAKRVTPSTATSKYDKARWAFREIFAARWGVKRIPPFLDKNQSYVPSRRKLVSSRFFEFVWTFSLAWYLEEHHLFDWDDYLDLGTLRWHGLSERQMFIRLYLVVRGTFIPYLGLRAGHSFATCIALIFGADPKDWPPLYGPVGEAYTIRRWYSHFWHHCMRRALASHGFLMTYCLFSLCHRLFSQAAHKDTRLKQSLQSPLARYLTTAFTFLVSAIMHILTCPGIELEMIVPQLWVHLGTAAAIVLEDTLIATYKSLRTWSATPAKAKGKPKESVEENTEAFSTGHHSSTAARSRRSNMATAQSPSPSLEDMPKQKGHEIKHIESATDENRPPLAWRAVGYVWVGCFWTWSISDLMCAIYSS